MLWSPNWKEEAELHLFRKIPRSTGRPVRRLAYIFATLKSYRLLWKDPNIFCEIRMAFWSWTVTVWMAGLEKEFQPRFLIQNKGCFMWGESTGKVEKKKAKNVGSSFVTHTFAVTPIWCQLESRFANAFETAIFIDTHPVKTHVPYAALIHIWKINTWSVLGSKE